MSLILEQLGGANPAPPVLRPSGQKLLSPREGDQFIIYVSKIS